MQVKYYIKVPLPLMKRIDPGKDKLYTDSYKTRRLKPNFKSLLFSLLFTNEIANFCYSFHKIEMSFRLRVTSNTRQTNSTPIF